MAVEKFMFDRSFDFDRPKSAKEPVEEVVDEEEEPEIELPTYSEEELEVAKLDAFEKGKEEALKESATAIESQIVDATKAIGEKLDSLIVGQLMANKDIFSDSIKVSHAITKKMFPSINAEQALPEIETIIGKILTQVLEEPRVVINVHPAIEADLVQRIDQIAADTHFEGRLHITGNESIAEGDCKIEWSNGGAERNLEDLLLEADVIIEANLGSLKGGYVPSLDADDLETLDKERAERPANGESPTSGAPPPSATADTAAQNEPAKDTETAQTSPPSPTQEEGTNAASDKDPVTPEAQNSADGSPPSGAEDDSETVKPSPATEDDPMGRDKISETNPSGDV
ncbi:MAG: hypothetical protein HQ483_10160 [Rhodospirillales bacterium]|nr:hypothetical protein [Rhodospirillales bacterium]